ncbi:MAG: insulinase family protein [Bacteroidales bacterium]|nr:insulinase family protein [Bacteroidales bacterium]MBN2762813.1 insulinase family protein [Bacteroidales bacterium]
MKSLYTLLILIALGANQLLTAQYEPDKLLPVDPDVRIGKLENGLTYYIRKNNKPENRVELRLAVNAGSVLEDDDQQGLAHFVEHMAFNGTKNFEKNELVHYLQSIGMKFGPEVNAYTGFDETVYRLTIPTDSAVFLQKGFQIMKDWAHNLLFDTTEINKERGVIMEEWRIGRGPDQRMQDKYFPVLFHNSKYAERLPIGKKEIIEGAPQSTIKRFYTDWYRPDLMAFVVVGDIDPDATEQTIQKMFMQIPLIENPRPRIKYELPDHQETFVVVASDKEAPYTVINIVSKSKAEPEIAYKDYRRFIITQLVSSMLNQRLDELREQGNPPLLYSASYYGELGAREMKAFITAGIVPETGLERGMQTLFEENERIMRHGFTQSELDRQKKSMQTIYENAFNERDKTESQGYAREYVSHYLSGEPIPGIAFEYEFVEKYLQDISLEEVNVMARQIIRRDNRVVVVQAPEKEGLVLPAEPELTALVKKTEASEVDPYIDRISGTSLMDEKPNKGRVLLTKKNADLGITEMKLSNGAKVVLKLTDFKNDEVLFRAISPGGYSLYSEEDFMSASNASEIVIESGVANYSPTDISKLLSGKKVNVSPYIDAYYEGFNGSSTPKDLESMLQLMYMYFTQPRKDSEAFQSVITKQKGIVENLLSDPENYFSNQYLRIKTQNNPRVEIIPSLEDIDRISYDRVFEIYSERFSDASGFTFFFVGAFKIDSLKPLIESYLASLPSSHTEENWQDMGIRAPEKMVDEKVYKGQDPKSIVRLYFESPETWTAEDAHLFESLESLLDIRYIDLLREEMSGVYGFGLNLSLVKIPFEHYEFSMAIPCSPENTDKLTRAALDEIRRLINEGVSEEDLLKIKEAERREMENDLKENNPWMGNLVEAYRLNDPGRIAQRKERIDSITSEELVRIAGKLNLDEYVRVVLYPEEK